MCVIRTTDVFSIRDKPLVTYIWCPRIVDTYIVHIVDNSITGYHHHMSAATCPVPRKGKRLLCTIYLFLQIVPAKCSIVSHSSRKSVFFEFRPPSVYTGIRNRAIATIGPSETLVGFVALFHACTQEFHTHFAAGSPAPHACFLGT